MDSATHSKEKINWLKRHRRQLMLAGPVLVLLVGGIFYLLGGRYVSTDDAYVKAARVAVSADVPGRVTAIDVTDNQKVHKGDVLFQLDDAPFKIAVQEAAAKLDSARLKVAAMKAAYQQKLADQQSADDALAYRERDYNRQKKLAAGGIASQARLDQAKHAFDDAAALAEAKKQDAAASLADLGGNPDIAVDDHPMVMQAQAALDRARLDLSYTTIYAPIDGVVAKVDQLQIGDYVKTAAPVFALVSDSDIWIEANFRETDLTYMKPGQHAAIDIDAYSGHDLSGKVVSASPGTGSSFALLPPENATGNWVKVVQRLPVRVSIDNPEGLPLKDGMSANVEVDTEHRRFVPGG